jgi:pilus assembly protein CpaD
MRMHPFPLAAAIVLVLAACRPAATEWTENEAPNRLRLDDAAVAVNLRFAAGSAYLLPADAQRLRAMAATGAISRSDRVTVAVGGGPGLAAARHDAIAAALLPYDIVTSPSPRAGLSANQAIVEVGRYVVTLPPCPNWSETAGTDFGNSYASNYACATQTNLGQNGCQPV